MKCPDCGSEMNCRRCRAESGEVWHAEVYESESGYYVIVSWLPPAFGPMTHEEAMREADMWEKGLR